MLYIIGLGLNVDGISKYGLAVAKKCKRVYLENYTVDFPYAISELHDVIGKKIIEADRKFVESLEIVDEAKRMDVALLVYGSPLSATTHISLIEECKKSGVRYKVIYAGSILDGVAETGLQLYKFGKIASMPAWKKSYSPDSFMEIVKDNQKINAHSLILIDIDLDFSDCLEQLEKSAEKQGVKLGKIVVCQRLGARGSKIVYRSVDELREFSGVKKPYCLILPGKLHFLERDVLEGFS